MGVDGVSGASAGQSRTAKSMAFILPQGQEQNANASSENTDQLPPEQSKQLETQFEDLKKNTAIIQEKLEEIREKLGSGAESEARELEEFRKLHDFQLTFDKAFQAGSIVAPAMLTGLYQKYKSKFYIPDPEIIEKDLRNEIATKYSNLECADLEKVLEQKISQKKTHGENSKIQTHNFWQFAAVAAPTGGAFHALQSLINSYFVPYSLDKLVKGLSDCIDDNGKRSIEEIGRATEVSSQLQKLQQELKTNPTPENLAKIMGGLLDAVQKQNGIILRFAQSQQTLLDCKNKKKAESAKSFLDYFWSINLFKTVALGTILSALSSLFYFSIRAKEADLTVPILEKLLKECRAGALPNKAEGEVGKNNGDAATAVSPKQQAVLEPQSDSEIIPEQPQAVPGKIPIPKAQSASPASRTKSLEEQLANSAEKFPVHVVENSQSPTPPPAVDQNPQSVSTPAAPAPATPTAPKPEEPEESDAVRRRVQKPIQRKVTPTAEPQQTAAQPPNNLQQPAATPPAPAPAQFYPPPIPVPLPDPAANSGPNSAGVPSMQWRPPSRDGDYFSQEWFSETWNRLRYSTRRTGPQAKPIVDLYTREGMTIAELMLGLEGGLLSLLPGGGTAAGLTVIEGGGPPAVTASTGTFTSTISTIGLKKAASIGGISFLTWLSARGANAATLSTPKEFFYDTKFDKSDPDHPWLMLKTFGKSVKTGDKVRLYAHNTKTGELSITDVDVFEATLYNRKTRFIIDPVSKDDFMNIDYVTEGGMYQVAQLPFEATRRNNGKLYLDLSAEPTYRDSQALLLPPPPPVPSPHPTPLPRP